jgi:hypothetical protein
LRAKKRKEGPLQSDQKKLEVFISYARSDASGFADELATGLEVAGFRPFVDRQSISAAEDWKKRIGVLIQQADTLIAVITPNAVKSDVFKWEVSEAVRLSKRIVPVEWLPTPIADIPDDLNRLNFIFFSSGGSFARGLKSLTEALETDLAWIREHTRLGERALEWATQYNRDENALLLGQQVAEAEAWLARRPPNAPAATALQLEFISSSRRVADERDNAERKRLAEVAQVQAAREEALRNLQRRTIYGLIAAGALVLLVGALAFFIHQQYQEIQQASLRLRAGMKLKIADTDRIIHATENWYRVATDHKLSIGILRDSARRYTSTGFLMRADTLHTNWGPELVFVTADHVIRTPGRDEADLAKLSASFPALGDESEIRFERLLYQSDLKDLDVAVMRISGKPPKNAVPIEKIAPAGQKDPLGGVAVLHWTAAEGFSLGFGHGIARPEAGDRVTADLSRRKGLHYYTHVTGGGASGAPVFDADTGNLVCLHQGGMVQAPRPWAYCTSIASVIERIAAEVPKH